MNEDSLRSHPAALYRWQVVRDYFLPLRPNSRILDIGTHDGYILAQIEGSMRVGLDLTLDEHPARTGIFNVEARAEQLPFCDGVYDYVFAFDVIEHIVRHKSALREMLRVVAPGGSLFFSTPMIGFKMIPDFMTPFANYRFGHVRNGYTVEQIEALLPDTGCWKIDYFTRNEPFFRAGFTPLHIVHQVAPAVAARLQLLAYQLDQRLIAGERGHIFGRIYRQE